MGEDLVIRLKSKIEELIARYESLKVENEELKARLAQSDAQLVTKTQKLNQLERQIGNLQLTEALKGSSGDSARAKRKVAALIKEIDKCIGLLND